MSAILPEHIIVTLGAPNVRPFCDAYSSYVNLYALLRELRSTADAGLANRAIPLLRERFFAVDADEPVSLGSQLDSRGALDRLAQQGAVAIPPELLAQLDGLTVKKLESLVAQFQVGALQLTVHWEGQVVQVVVNRDASMLQLLQTLGRKVGRDLMYEYVFMRKSSGISRRRGTVLMADEPIVMTHSIREAQVVEDEIIMCVKSKAAAERSSVRVRVTVPSQNSSVELPLADGLVVSAVIQEVLGSSSGVLIMFRPGNVEDCESKLLDPVRTLSSYKMKLGDHQLVCFTTAEWEQGSDDYTTSNGPRSWVALIADWGTFATSKGVRAIAALKGKLRAGVPPWARGFVWGLMLNAYRARAEQPGLYATLVIESPPSRTSGRWESDRQVVFRDVARTFPQHPFYFTGSNGAPGMGLKPLQNLLLAWHSMEPRIGYCQGINFVAAVFLLEMEEELAFWCVHSLLTNHGLENLYKSGLPLLTECLDLFQQLVERSLPKLAEFFALHGVPVSSFATPWFHTLFSSKFPLNLVCRLFDMFLREGFCVIFRMALALLKENQAEILAIHPDELFQYLQDPEKLLHGLGEDEWIMRLLKIKKTKEMNISASSSADHGARLRPVSVPIAPVLKKVGSMFQQLGSTVKDIKAGSKSPRGAGNSGSIPHAAIVGRHSLTASQTPPGGNSRYEELDSSQEADSDMASIWMIPDDGVLLMQGNEIVAGTPEKLVERLTSPKFPGQLYTDAFLLTFRTFLMPLRLMQLLRSRLEHIPRPQPVSRESALSKSSKAVSSGDFATEVVQPIRLRVFTCLRLWIAAYPRDFDDPSLQHELELILNNFRSASGENMADRLQRGMELRPAPTRPMHPPSLTVPSAAEREKRVQALFDKLEPVQLAKLLCLLDRKAYSSCQPHHLMESGPSVQSVLKWNAKLASWVESSILHNTSLDTLVNRFQFFVMVADACLSMNDVSAMMTLGLALRWVLTSAVPKVFSLLKRCRLGAQQRWAFLSTVIEKDFASLTEARFFLDRYRGSNAAIPWINCFVDAARTIWSEMPDTLSLEPNRPNAVNFQKRLLLWQIVEGFLVFQHTEYEANAPPIFATCDVGSWTTSQVSDIIWSEEEIPRDTLCEGAGKLSHAALKWTSTVTARYPVAAASPTSSPQGSPRLTSPRASPRGGGLLGAGRTKRTQSKAGEENE